MNFITGIQIKYSNFSNTLEKAKDSASSISKSTETLKKVFIKRIDIKKKSFTREKLFKRRKLETSRRKEKEQKLETIPMTGKIGKSFSGILQKASSPFSAIMNTLGLLALGWLINNLPSIIKFVKDLYNRVVKIVDTIKSFISNLGNWFKNIGGVITAVKDNITNLDFTDSEGKLKNALEKLDKSFESMKNDIEEGKRLLTTPLGQEVSGGSTGGGGGEFSAEITDDERAALSVLAKYESGAAGYDAVNQGGSNDGRTVLGYSGDIKGMSQHGGRSLTDMTIGEIKQLQYDDKSMSMDQWNASGKLHAVGRYQFIGNTLPGVAARAGFGDDVKFTKAVQDKMAIQLIKERGISPWVGPSDKATPAERQSVRKVQMEKGGSGGKYGSGGGNVVEYITGDRRHPNFEYNGHGRESNYHEHIAFKTLQDKEKAKAALRAAGIQVGSEYRPGDPGWHGANLAIDVRRYQQWGGMPYKERTLLKVFQDISRLCKASEIPEMIIKESHVLYKIVSTMVPYSCLLLSISRAPKVIKLTPSAGPDKRLIGFKV